jgi:hypothetical protein
MNSIDPISTGFTPILALIEFPIPAIIIVLLGRVLALDKEIMGSSVAI